MTDAFVQIKDAFRGLHHSGGPGVDGGAGQAGPGSGSLLGQADDSTQKPYKAFIPYIVAGDPDIPGSMEVIRAAVAGGADLVEIGIPFSDPTAEGPVIQQVSERALKAGTTTDKVFQMVRDLRAGRDYSGDQAARNAAAAIANGHTVGLTPGNAMPEMLANAESKQGDPAHTSQKPAGLGESAQPMAADNGTVGAEAGQTSSIKPVTVPLVFMTYANVVFSYGAERFIRTCAQIGVTGLILPDVPLEERGEFIGWCDQYGIGLIPLIAPTSADRIASIAQAATGWIYVVSSLGVTGMRSEITTDLGAITRVIRENTDLPCAIGFGISTPEQAAAIAPHADGVIVGSAIVKIVAQYGHDAPARVRDYVSSMVAAIR